MSGVCSVCLHPQRAEIEQKLGENVSVREIGKLFGVGFSSVQRHRTGHMGKKGHAAPQQTPGPARVTVVDEVHTAASLATRMLEQAEGELTSGNKVEGLRQIVALRRELRMVLDQLDRMRAIVQPKLEDLQVDPREVSQLARLSPPELVVVCEQLASDARALAARQSEQAKQDARELAERRTTT